MKILHLSKKLPFPPRDGEEVAILRNIETFLECGNRVVFLALTNTPIQNSALRSFVSKYPNFSVDYVNIDLEINVFKLIFFDIFGKNPYIAHRFISADYRKKIEKYIREIKPDVVFAESLYTAVYFQYFSSETSFLKVYRAHNLEHEIWQKRSQNEKNIFLRLYFAQLSQRLKKLEQNIISLSDKILAISKSDLSYIQSVKNKNDVALLPVAIQTSNYTNLHTCSQNVFLYLGSLNWYPNIEGLDWFLSQVWPVILEKMPEAQFFIAGKYAAEKWVEKIVEIPGVHFVGEIKEPSEFYKKGCVLVSPLFTGSGIRIKILEAFAEGIPAVASPSAVQGLGIENKKEIIVALTPREFAEECINLARNEDLRKHLVENAQKFMEENFGKKKTDKFLIDYLKSALLSKNT